MKYFNRQTSNKGIGIVEVIAATFIIAFGLLATASFHGNLLTGSSTATARSEALKLAQVKLEGLRNSVTVDEYNNNAEGSHTDTDGNTAVTITGSNAVFTRTWTITDLVASRRKMIEVSVVWASQDGEQKEVSVLSEIAWSDGGKSLAIIDADEAASGGDAPSPNNNSAVLGAVDDKTYSPDPDELIPETTFYRDENNSGHEVIIDASGGVLITCFHTCLEIKGTVYLEKESEFGLAENDFIDKKFNIEASDFVFCEFPLASPEQVTVDGNNIYGADYVCFVGSDCTDTTPGTNGCPDSASVIDSTVIGVGGWRGNIGITGFPKKVTTDDVCFAEDMGLVDGVTSSHTSSRSYDSIRTNDAGEPVGSEGINTPYSCHDFLVIRNPANKATACLKYQALAIAPSEIKKYLSGNADNVVLPEDTSSCNAL